MKKSFPLILLLVSLVACTVPGAYSHTEVTPVPTVAQPRSTVVPSAWSLYDPDPQHPWNRLFRQLYRRTAGDGAEYGSDELDPLLWQDTGYLLEGDSHAETLRALDEFLAEDAEALVRDPLPRAMFQRDLWAVFDWITSQAEPHAAERGALARRLVQVMRRVALSRAEIESLPDNYLLAVESGLYAARFQEERAAEPFLPEGILQEASAWVPVGREAGPVAMTHTEAFPFFGRSVFQVYLRSPAGRSGTLDWIEALRVEKNPVTPIGAKVALVRRMLLIDDQGEMVLSPLVETVQVRHFSPGQSFYEFELDRERLFAGAGGGLVPNRGLFMLFMGHGDVFESDVPSLQATIPEICKACHDEYPPIPNSGNTRSILSYSRDRFPLPDEQQPAVVATTEAEEAAKVIAWKEKHQTWESLEVLWGQPGS